MNSDVKLSRIARKPILIPNTVNIKIDNNIITATGPKGNLQYKVNDLISIKRENDQLLLAFKDIDHDKLSSSMKLIRDNKFKRSIAGTMRASIDNLIKGVSDGYEVKLILVGVGYRAQVKGNKLNISLGFSHGIDFDIPKDIAIETPSQTEIIIKGFNKNLVGQVAADIKSIRPVEPYKGKGVRYSDEIVILKSITFLL